MTSPPSAPDARAQHQFRRTIAIFLATGCVALAGVVLSAGVLMAMFQRQAAMINHTYLVERKIAAIRAGTAQLAAARLRHAQNLADARANPVAQARRQLSADLAGLDALTRDNPRQQARLPLLIAATLQIGLQAQGPLLTGPDGRALIDAPSDLVTALTGAMLVDEEHLLAIRASRQRVIDRGFYTVLGVTGLLLLIIGALVFTTIGSYTRELDSSRRALRRANTGLEGAVQERTAQLQRANSEIQRFAYIVSHDLRSPLVNVMGFTAEMETATATLLALLEKAEAERPETVSDEARAIVREDMPEAIHFIRSSTQKMDRLINAILHLSRLGRRELKPEWLDLGELAQGVIDTLRIRIDEAGGEVEIIPPLPHILADRVALEQILANLVENALKYRHRDRPPRVRISARASGAMVEIVVTDNGRGIDPRDHERVFDLFRRSGAQDQAGEGIGLAHARALAYRMEGTIGLESALGNGATFTLHLPRRYSGASSQAS